MRVKGEKLRKKSNFIEKLEKLFWLNFLKKKKIICHVENLGIQNRSLTIETWEEISDNYGFYESFSLLLRALINCKRNQNLKFIKK